MAEEVSQKAEPNKSDRRPPKPRGVGAEAGSDRREFRRFRAKPKPKEDPAVSTEGGQPAAGVKKQRNRPPPFCRYFNSAKGCRTGAECPFRHVKREKKVDDESALPNTSKDEESPDIEPSTEQTTVPAVEPAKASKFVPPNVSQRPSIPLKIILHKEDSGLPPQLSARNSDLSYFKRRYRYSTITKESNGSDLLTFKYGVTDPEWVFDVKTITFSLRLLDAHPIQPPLFVVPGDANRIMPEILRKHVERSINEAILQRYKLFEEQNEYETVGKLLIRYIDRNIRTMFIEGLKKTRLVYQAEAAGISLVVPSATKSSQDQSDDSHSSSIDESEEEDEEDSSTEIERLTENLNIEDIHTITEADPDSTKLPIDVILVWHNTSRNIASIAAVSLNISTNCTRCKAEESHEVSATSNKSVQWRCIKCAMAQSMQLKGLLVHENSSVLCELDCRGCRPLDCILLQSHLIFTCLACNKEDNVQHLNYGQFHKSWCRGCHAECEFSVTAIRFRGDFTRLTLEDKDAAKNMPKIKKKVESHAVVTPGAPLPENGTCKHYKKSYRWFRFPCCGKVFPCDSCHEAANLGHEMKLANRMICGHCSHEQPFQKSKPCASCEQNVVRTRSQFWEGGKGCRDQKAMNKNDGRKFTNSRKKTVSKAKVGQLVVKTKKEAQ